MFKSLIGKVYDNRCKLVCGFNYLDIINFEKILIFEESNIVIKTKEKLVKIKGDNLVINKSFDGEVLISGTVKTIEFR